MPGLSAWYRYYHAPGVGHCGGDVGASPTLTIAPDGQAQMFTDLVNWVEKGIEPQSAGDSTHKGILATGPGSFGTRPICPYPTTAIYNGTGATTVASNYHCGGNLDTPVTLCQLPITRYGHATSSLLNYEEVDVHPEDCE
jgi:feruloyl esterase